MWNTRNVDLLAKQNPKHAEFYKEFADKVQPTFLTPRAVDRAFGLAKPTVVSADPEGTRDKKFDVFVAGLTQKTSQALARMFFETHSGVFDEDFETLAKTKNLSLAKYFGRAMAQVNEKQKGTEVSEEASLQKAVREVHEAFQDIDDEAAMAEPANDGETLEKLGAETLPSCRR